MRWWIRDDVRHSPAHAVVSWDAAGRRVVTVCGWTPSPGGRVLDLGQVLALQAFCCRGCAREARQS